MIQPNFDTTITTIKKFLALVVFIFTIHADLHGQAHDQTYGHTKITTPDVASFNKFIDQPISTYTGTPDINIPLYALQDGAIELPVELRYHSSGFKVSEEASWVGLGWNLNVGGFITQDVIGAYDGWDTNFDLFMNDGFFFSQNQGLNIEGLWKGGYFDLEYHQDVYDKLYCMARDHAVCTDELGKLQPDVFSFSYPGNSGKFIIDYLNNNEPRILKKERNISIDVIYNGSSVSGFNIIDNGVVHTFNTPSLMYSIVSGSNEVSTVSYRLASSTYPNGESVLYSYNEIDILVPSINENLIYPFLANQDFPFAPPYSDLKQRYKDYDHLVNQYYGKESQLSSISTTNYTLNFHTSPRSDVENGKKLDSLEISRKNNTSQFDLTYVFDTDYFVSSESQFASYWNAQEWPVGTTNATHRLKLNAIKKKVNNSLEHAHAFNYNNVLLPRKDSYAVDYWGYFNGKESQSTLIPDFSYLNYVYLHDMQELTYTDEKQRSKDISRLWFEDKADRTYNFASAQACLLKGMQYSTGGYTEFEYEPHTFSRIGIVTRDDDRPDYFIPNATELTPDFVSRSVSDYNLGTSDFDTVSFTLTDTSNVDITVTFDRGDRTWEEILELPYVVDITDLSDGTKPWHYHEFQPVAENVQQVSVLTTLPPGSYRLEVDHPATPIYPNGHLDADIMCSWIPPFPKPEYSTGAGIRIKSIKHFDSPTDLNSNLSYTYEYINATGNGSSGVLFDFPVFAKKQENINFRYSVYYGFDGTICYVDIESLGYCSGSSCMVYDQVGCNSFFIDLFYISPRNTHSNPYGINSGLGYERVKVSQNGSEQNGFTIYQYHTDDIFYWEHELASEADQPNVESYPVRNGKLKSVISYDASGSEKKEERYYYQVTKANRMIKVNTINNYNTNISLLLPSSSGNLYVPTPYIGYTGTDDATVHIQEIFSRDLVLIKIETELDSVVITENFEYNDLLQVEQRTKELDNGNEEKIDYRYPNDINSGIYQLMADLNVNAPVETIIRYNEKVINSSLQTYQSVQSHYVPEYTFKASINQPLTSYIEFDGTNADGAFPSTPEASFLRFDQKTNLLEYKGRDGIHHSIYWGYDFTGAVAEISNLTYAEIEGESALINYLNDLDNFNLIDNSNRMTLNTLNANIRAFIRTAFGDDVFIITYTHDPMVGITSKTDHNGFTEYYEYDIYGRLARIRDPEYNIVKSIDYNYRN